MAIGITELQIVGPASGIVFVAAFPVLHGMLQARR